MEKPRPTSHLGLSMTLLQGVSKLTSKSGELMSAEDRGAGASA